MTEQQLKQEYKQLVKDNDTKGMWGNLLPYGKWKKLYLLFHPELKEK
jgi:hypothetical protein